MFERDLEPSLKKFETLEKMEANMKREIFAYEKALYEQRLDFSSKLNC